MANRSAAHVRLKQWEQAETDLSVILGDLCDYRKYKENMEKCIVYPFGSHTTPEKLWERRYNCLCSLKRYDDAKLCLDIYIELVTGIIRYCISITGFSNVNIILDILEN